MIKKELRFYKLMITPAMVSVLVIIGFPIIFSLYLSFHRINVITQKWMFVGIDNYIRIMPDSEFLYALLRTIYFTFVTVLIQLIIGFVIAIVLNNKFYGRNLLRSVVLIPWAMSPIAVGILWSWILNGNFGSLNGILFDLNIIGEPIFWFGNGTMAFHLVALVHIWNQAPLCSLLILSGLQTMPENIIKAAKIDGASNVKIFFKITIPWLKPVLLLLLILISINSIMAFDIFWILTKGGPGSSTTVFSWLGYAHSFQYFKFGEGAAILFVLTLICLILAGIYLKILFPKKDIIQTKRINKETKENKFTINLDLIPKKTLNFKKNSVIKKKLKNSFFIVLVMVVYVWSLLPFVILLNLSLQDPVDIVRVPATVIPGKYTLDNYKFVLFPEYYNVNKESDLSTLSDSQLYQRASIQAKRVPISIQNSIIVGLLVTIINVIFGTMAGYSFSRSNNNFMRGSLWILMLTRMTPSLVLILPFFMVFRKLNLIDTHLGLIIAYCSLILPLSTWLMKSYFDGIPKNIEKAARIDGCSRMRTFLKIATPIAVPGIVATAIFCFLVSWNEFIFALVLTSTPNSQTIPLIISGYMAQLRSYDYGPLFASSILSVLPPVLITIFFQKYLIQGMLSGSLKG